LPVNETNQITRISLAKWIKPAIRGAPAPISRNN
jgi:hypothetical protein